MEDEIASVKKIGGKCFIAHPKLWGYTQLEVENHIESAFEAGLTGIEKWHSECTYEHECIGTMGSDFHGMTVHPHVEVGKYKSESITATDVEALL